MQTNLTHYEDMMQLEDDILCFLPTVSDIDVFGCEVDLIDFDTQLPLPAAFHTALMQQRKLQIVVRPCMVEGHSIWQFQEGDRESYPKAVRVPVNPRREIADRAFYAAPMLRHVEIAAGIQHVGFAAWQGCQQLQIVKLPSSVLSLEDGAFQGCYALREVVAPGCVQYSRRVFAECCSLSRVGVSREADDSNVLAPGAQLGRYAFESCLTLTSITFAMDQTNKARALPEGAFCGAGIETLCLPSDFHNIGPRACENCKRLVEVNLMCTEITALLKSTFAQCVCHDPHLAAATPNANRQRSFPQLHSAPRGGHSDRAPGNRHSGLLWVRAVKMLYSPRLGGDRPTRTGRTQRISDV